MKGMKLTFEKQIEVGRNMFNDPAYQKQIIEVDDCLIAPITEPSNAREQQALEQNREQLRIHLPKAFDGDVSNSYVIWLGRKYKVDSDGTAFMNENTPGRWNRYFRAERINV